MDKLQLLRDSSVYPSDGVLSEALGGGYSAYTRFMNRLKDSNIETEWRYYNDGKSWLGKNTHKKKTVFWLSVWDGFFKISLFFTEATAAGLPVKKAFEPPVGKLIPLVLSIHSDTDLDEVFKIIEYKRNLK